MMSKMISRLFILLMILPLIASTTTRQERASQGYGGIVLIVNKANPIDKLSSSKIKVIFMRNISRWPWGAEIAPVDLPDSNPARRTFLRSLIGSTREQMEVYWIDQKVSRSIDRPLRVASPKEAKMLVASRPGAIAYIPAEEVDGTVRVLEVK